MKYGNTKEVTVIDDEGSTVAINYDTHDGATRPTFKETRIKVKVRNLKEEMHEYLQYTGEASRAKDAGESKEPIGFEYERNNHGKMHGYYYVIKCWREKI